ncbi:MAG: hypothetical protein HYZ28_20740 [Myxococcales bacterium]|nr:hypothetical protein [Myxococcales bacterium]
MRETRLWQAAVLGLTLAALWPIWASEVPPLQDYPQHLFDALLIAERGNPELPLARYYRAEGLSVAYAAFYFLVGLFYRVVSIETAGKLCLTIYWLSVAGALWMANRKLCSIAPRSEASWALLLAFPLAVSPVYLLGLVNYCFSLPILMAALLHQRRIEDGPLAPSALAAQGLLLLLMLATHPYTALAYVGLSLVAALASYRSPAQVARGAACSGVALAVVGTWLLLRGEKVGAGTLGDSWWHPFGANLGFLALQFTGFRLESGPDFLSVGLWLGAAALLFHLWWRGRRELGAPERLEQRRWAGILLVTLIAFFTLPFSNGTFHYFNLRLSGAAYLALAVLAGTVRVQGLARFAVVALAFALVLEQGLHLRRLSKEMAEPLALAERLPPEALVLPLVFDASSPELERGSFDPHLHTHFFHQLRRKAGFTPYLFPTPSDSIAIRPEQRRPAPPQYEPGRFRWEEHGSDYDAFLVRGAPPDFLEYLSRQARPVARSGAWWLYLRGGR